MRKQAIKTAILAVNADSLLRFCGTRPQPHPARKGRVRGLRRQLFADDVNLFEWHGSRSGLRRATHRHFVGVANPAEPTRRTILAYLAGAAFFLSSCMPSKQPKKAKRCPTWSSRAPKTSRICPFNARETLWRDIQPSRRRGGVGVVRPDYSKPSPTNYARGPTLTRRKTSAALLKPTTTPISWHSLWTTTPNIASRIR